MKKPTPFHKIKSHVIEELRTKLSPKLAYHNADHTLEVLHSSEKIAAAEQVSEEGRCLLRIAVLYHDAGFIRSYENHEHYSVEIAKEELPAFGFTDEQIEKISKIILATRRIEDPEELLEKIICDADVYYLGTSKFKRLGDNLFQELSNFDIVNDQKAWDQIQINFLKKHKYYTNFCQINREPFKQQNLIGLINKYASDKVSATD